MNTSKVDNTITHTFGKMTIFAPVVGTQDAV